MRLKRALLELALAALPFTIAAPPAAASCQTNPDVGDFCKVEQVLCANYSKIYDFLTHRC